jgi:16S rRNA (guanine1207-N2)-methyltransferase
MPLYLYLNMKEPHNRLSYLQSREFSISLSGQTVHYYSKPGIPEWERVTPASLLLAEYTELTPEARVLQLGCRHGALAVALARRLPAGEIWLTDNNIIALQMAEKTLRANAIDNANLHRQISVLPAGFETFDTVVVEIPKGRQLIRRWLLEAFNALRMDGCLYLAGSNEQGIHSAIKDAEALFGEKSILGYKKGHRLARFTKDTPLPPAPAWASEPGVHPETWLEFEVEALGRSMRLYSLPGVFSSKRPDDGTRLLLSHLEVPPGARLLDLGCGYGLIGLIAAQRGATNVDMVDTNLLAIAAAQANLALYGIQNAQAFLSDALEAVIDRRYTHVVTNPPFHVGHSVDYQVTQAFIQQAWQVLEPGGQLLLVANKFIRYDLEMTPLFKHVERMAETNRYQLLSARKAA